MNMNKKIILAFTLAFAGIVSIKATTITLVDDNGICTQVTFRSIFAHLSPSAKAACRYMIQSLQNASEETLAALVGSIKAAGSLRMVGDVISSVDDEGYVVEVIRQTMEDAMVQCNGNVKHTNKLFRDKLKNLEDEMEPYFSSLAHEEPAPGIIERVKNVFV